MNSIRIWIVFVLTLSFLSLDAQVYDRRGQTVYLEFGGPALFASLNYESRFQETTEGLGGRLGVAYMEKDLIIPVGVNYLLGKKDKSQFLELGGGVSFWFYDEPERAGGKDLNRQIYGFGTAMYRIHPRYGKFLFKIGLTPIIGVFDEEEDKVEALIWIGVAFGYAF